MFIDYHSILFTNKKEKIKEFNLILFTKEVITK